MGGGEISCSRAALTMTELGDSQMMTLIISMIDEEYEKTSDINYIYSTSGKYRIIRTNIKTAPLPKFHNFQTAAEKCDLELVSQYFKLFDRKATVVFNRMKKVANEMLKERKDINKRTWMIQKFFIAFSSIFHGDRGTNTEYKQRAPTYLNYQEENISEILQGYMVKQEEEKEKEKEKEKEPNLKAMMEDAISSALSKFDKEKEEKYGYLKEINELRGMLEEAEKKAQESEKKAQKAVEALDIAKKDHYKAEKALRASIVHECNETQSWKSLFTEKAKEVDMFSEYFKNKIDKQNLKKGKRRKIEESCEESESSSDENKDKPEEEVEAIPDPQDGKKGGNI